jgi:lipopolysaccharide export system permease protein
MSYLRPFLRSFLVCLFILVLQFLSRYKSDLFGKGLSTSVIFEIFGYATVSLVVLALPVAVLLSSLFAMGNFGENYELAAMRSAGMSIPKILRPMVIVTLLITLFSFGLSSFVAPWANLGLYRTLYDVGKMKPAFRLEPGHFNSAIDNYVIRITGKDISREMLYGISIYDHTPIGKDTMPIRYFHYGTSRQKEQVLDSAARNNRIIRADSGTMIVDPYGRYMNMRLYHGSTFETKVEWNPKGYKEERVVRILFDSLYYAFDMKGFAMEETEDQFFSSHQYMLNISQLSFAIDTIQRRRNQLANDFSKRLGKIVNIDSSFIAIDSLSDVIPPDNILLHFPKNERKSILEKAKANMTNAIRSTFDAKRRLGEKDLAIRERGIELNFKLSLPMACLIFLFIGAPLGAIIRKGGAGIPIIVSLVLYLAFYVLMIQGKKMAQEGVISPWFGAWLPVLVMLPLALFLSFESASPVRVFTADNFWRFARQAVRILIITNPIYWLYRIPIMGRAMRFVFTPIGRLFRRKEEKRTFRVRR